MKRMILYVPVLVVGLPLLICLVAASSQLGSTPETTMAEQVVPDVSKEGTLPDAKGMERLAESDPVAFLENCIRRYKQEVQGYTLVMQKQEYIGGTLHPKELIEVAFKEQPYSVYFRWIEGARKAERVLYVEGENDGKMLARPNGALQRTLVGDVVERDVDGSEAKASGRLTLNQYGVNKACERTLVAWKAAKEQGTLVTKFLGVRQVPETENRTCYVVHRTSATPENDGVLEQTIFIDTENWLQTGIIAKGKGGQLIGEYYSRNIVINPSFKKDQFARVALVP